MTARLRGLAATSVLLGLLIGLPTLLLALGPITLPASWQQALDGLLRPDDGTLAVNLIKALAWTVWATLAATVTVEALAWARHLQPPRPVLGRPQLLVRDLVAAAVLLFVATPAVGQPTPAAAQPVPVHIAEAVHPTDTAHPLDKAHHREQAAKEERATVEHVVRKGESLWSIALDHLGDGERYPDIARLNRHLIGDDPGFLRPGWTLRLPAPDKVEQPAGVGQTTRYVVRKGDTLSEIAQDQLGNAHAYPRIVEASRRIDQPGGRHLTDPDQIDVGWTLNIPTAHNARPETARVRQHRPTMDTPPAEQASAVPPSTATLPTPVLTSTPSPEQSARQVAETPAGASALPTLAAGPPASQEGAPAAATEDLADVDEAQDAPPSWLLAGLSGAGSLLAAGLLLWLRRARGAQRRARRPGRTIAMPPVTVAAVEKTVIAAGSAAFPTLQLIDQALRRLTLGEGQPMPRIAAVEVSDRQLTLHLAAPADLPAPWKATPDAAHWSVPVDIQPGQLGPVPEPDSAAPYPQLATVGTSDSGAIWLLNLEELGTLALTGDPIYAADLARGIAAEIAINPWTRDVTIDCVGIAEQAAELNPVRARHYTTPDVTGDLLTEAVRTADRLTEAGSPDISTARAVQAGWDLWEGRLLILDGSHTNHDTLDPLIQLVNDQPGRTGIAVVIVGSNTPHARHTLELTPIGRLRFDEVGLTLTPSGLTLDEAHGCAVLITAAEDLDDVPIPEDPVAADGWRALTDQSGALRSHLTSPRSGPVTEPSTTLLDGPNIDYTSVAATTNEDLDALSPKVPLRARTAVETADPALDVDLALWRADDSTLPRLWLLGPVKGRTGGGGDPSALLKRKAHTIELAAFLATRPRGATTADVAEAFGIAPDRVRKDMAVVRRWLGTNPRTGRPHLPDATTTKAAKAHGIATYELEDVLSDTDLFRRLRARGQAAGAEGIADLRSALTLVTGTPFSKLRADGGAWLTEGDRLDQHLLCAIVDVAHIVATDALRQGDTVTARQAAETAHQAAPDEDIPRLDLAAALAAQNRHAEADHLIRDLCDRTDSEEGGRSDLPDRTDFLIRQHDWLKKRRAAS